jgi:ABC-type bacteriocin/lantibiotic exporter with double-glycine peptidase domain
MCQLQHLESIIQAKVEDENGEKIVENEERQRKIKIQKLFLKFAQAH